MSESFQLIAGRDNPTGILGKNAKISIINIFQYFKIDKILKEILGVQKTVEFSFL